MTKPSPDYRAGWNEALEEVRRLAFSGTPRGTPRRECERAVRKWRKK